VIAEQAGHAMHTALVQKIMRDPSCYEVVTAEVAEPKAVAVAR
jgi:UDP-3-O-acyl-N-acetylglucosamine deacetylase